MAAGSGAALCRFGTCTQTVSALDLASSVPDTRMIQSHVHAWHNLSRGVAQDLDIGVPHRMPDRSSLIRHPATRDVFIQDEDEHENSVLEKYGRAMRQTPQTCDLDL